MVTEPQFDETSYKDVILTFDDGPSVSQTPLLLDIFQEHQIRVVFFVLGKRLSTPEGIEIASRAVSEGHTLGNHSYSHPDLTSIPLDELRDELQKTHDLIAKCKWECKLFRPPFGKTSPLVDKVALEMGYSAIMWNVNSIDWKLKVNGEWVDQTISKIGKTSQSVVLLHDIHESTVSYMDEFIRKIKEIPRSRILTNRID